MVLAHHAAQSRAVAARLLHRPARRHLLGVRRTARWHRSSRSSCRSTTSAAENTTSTCPASATGADSMPAWARGRRAEIVERLQTVFKRSQIHFDPTRRSPRPPVAEQVVVLVRLRPVGRERPAYLSRCRGSVAAVLLGRARQPRRLAQTSRAGARLLQRAAREGLGRAAQRRASRDRVAREGVRRGRDHAERGQPARTRRLHACAARAW